MDGFNKHLLNLEIELDAFDELCRGDQWNTQAEVTLLAHILHDARMVVTNYRLLVEREAALEMARVIENKKAA